MEAIIKTIDEEYNELEKAAAIHPGAGRGAPGMPRKFRKRRDSRFEKPRGYNAEVDVWRGLLKKPASEWPGEK